MRLCSFYWFERTTLQKNDDSLVCPTLRLETTQLAPHVGARLNTTATENEKPKTKQNKSPKVTVLQGTGTLDPG